MPRHSLEVEPLEWSSEFLPWFEKAWKPGEHVSIIAPTGAGKTTFAAGILNLRKYVLVMDIKGGDSTLEGMGYPRLAKWPGAKSMGATVRKNDDDGNVSRYLIGNKARTKSELAQLKATLATVLDETWEMGGWTLYADELIILTSQKLFNLGTRVDQILVGGRDLGVSMVSSFQAPTWVTPMAGKQSTWVAISYTRDTDVVNRLAEILGRPKAEIRGAVQALEEYSWIVVGRNPREPLRVTIPDYVAPRKPEVAS